VNEHAKRDRKGSPLPWEVKGCLICGPEGEMVAYVQYDRDRREMAASPIVTDALDGIIRDIVALAALADPEGLDGCEEKIPGIRARYDAAYEAMNRARWRKQ